MTVTFSSCLVSMMSGPSCVNNKVPTENIVSFEEIAKERGVSMEVLAANVCPLCWLDLTQVVMWKTD